MMGVSFLLFLLLCLCSALPVKRIVIDNSEAKRSSSRIPLQGGTPKGYYVVSMTMDSQLVNVLIDTGSNLLGVVSEGCRDGTQHVCPAPSMTGLFKPDPAKRATCVELPGCCRGGKECTASAAYLDGTQAMGAVYSARTTFGNYSAVKVFLAAVTREVGY